MTMRQPPLICLLFLALVLIAFAPAGVGAPLRLATWDLGEASGDAAKRIHDAAAALKKQNPNVILLQNVRDWEVCNQLAAALKPAEYHVLVCSTFRDVRTGAACKQQVAILSKRKAYFSWSEPWSTDAKAGVSGGFSFAAIRVEDQRLGLFAVQMDDALLDATNAHARAAVAQQWLKEFKVYKNWVTNRIDAAVIAASFNSTADDSLRSLLAAPLDEPRFLPEATNQLHAKLAAARGTMPAVVLDRYPAVCQLDLLSASPTPPAVAGAAGPAIKPKPQAATNAPARMVEPVITNTEPVVAKVALPPPAAPSVPVVQAASGLTRQPWMPGALAGAGGLVLALFAWLLLRRRQPSADASVPAPTVSTVISLQAGNTGSVVIASQSVTGSAGEPESQPLMIRPVVQLEMPDAHANRDEAEAWKARALAAEQRAGQATEQVRQGMVEWLKQKFVRKLISDRRELLATQQVATLKALAVDERLSRIESQIQQQNDAYERRIDELIRELAVAREENRELIRARIAQVKLEMEAARARLIREAQENDGEGMTGEMTNDQ